MLLVTFTQYSDFNQSVIMNFLRFLCWLCWLCMVVCTDKLDKLDNFCEGRAICKIEFTGFKRYAFDNKHPALERLIFLTRFGKSHLNISTLTASELIELTSVEVLSCSVITCGNKISF